MIYMVLLVLAHWGAGTLALRHEGRGARYALEPLLAPFGRVRTVPTGTEVLAAKRYRYGPDTLGEPIRAWFGWWNCRRFRAGGERYYFFHRKSNLALLATEVR